MTSDMSVRVARRIPLPSGDEPQTWLLDTTPWTQVFRTFHGRYPFRYSDTGRRVRLLMPRRGLMRTDRLLRELTAYVRFDPTVSSRLSLPSDWTPEERARLMLTSVIFDPDTSFIAYTVHPDGRVVANSGKFDTPNNARLSWHPAVAGDR